VSSLEDTLGSTVSGSTILEPKLVGTSDVLGWGSSKSSRECRAGSVGLDHTLNDSLLVGGTIKSARGV
jgi:hypothetical protein